MRYLVIALCLAFSWPAYSSNLDMYGDVSYTYSVGTSTATLEVERIDNLEASGTSGSLHLELWAFSTPYAGVPKDGYKMAQYYLNPLQAGYHYSNVDSGNILFVRPPDGTWTFTIVLTEYTGEAVNNGYSTRDWINFDRTETFGVPKAPVGVGLVEYYHTLFDHYFVTPLSAEIALLDARQPPFQYWQRTGYSFNAWAPATAPSGSVPICRLFNDQFAPKSSHFYAPQGSGCEVTLALFPDWTLEDATLFNTALPNSAGSCPAGLTSVFRLYNNGMGGAPNHRFVTSAAERQRMINQGWTPEGNGAGVGMCVPT